MVNGVAVSGWHIFIFESPVYDHYCPSFGVEAHHSKVAGLTLQTFPSKYGADIWFFVLKLVK